MSRSSERRHSDPSPGTVTISTGPVVGLVVVSVSSVFIIGWGSL
jgi:hypothetical protein